MNFGIWEVGTERPLNGVNRWQKPEEKKNFFAAEILHHSWSKNVQIWDHFFLVTFDLLIIFFYAWLLNFYLIWKCVLYTIPWVGLSPISWNFKYYFIFCCPLTPPPFVPHCSVLCIWKCRQVSRLMAAIVRLAVKLGTGEKDKLCGGINWVGGDN